MAVCRQWQFVRGHFQLFFRFGATQRTCWQPFPTFRVTSVAINATIPRTSGTLDPKKKNDKHKKWKRKKKSEIGLSSSNSFLRDILSTFFISFILFLCYPLFCSWQSYSYCFCSIDSIDFIFEYFSSLTEKKKNVFFLFLFEIFIVFLHHENIWICVSCDTKIIIVKARIHRRNHARIYLK